MKGTPLDGQRRLRRQPLSALLRHLLHQPIERRRVGPEAADGEEWVTLIGKGDITTVTLGTGPGATIHLPLDADGISARHLSIELVRMNVEEDSYSRSSLITMTATMKTARSKSGLPT